MSSASIKQLNDAFRSSFAGGKVMLTDGVRNLPPEQMTKLLSAVQAFQSFNDDNDPHGEHDFGSIEITEDKFFWKIDYYAQNLEDGSPDPTDPKVTTRVLTVMRADEY